MSPLLGIEGAGELDLRAAATATWSQNNMPGGFVQAASNATTQQMLLNELKFAAARSIRTSTIILACFNTVAAFATAMGILYDSYTRAKRNNRRYKFT
jgi:hypothetical protein